MSADASDITGQLACQMCFKKGRECPNAPKCQPVNTGELNCSQMESCLRNIQNVLAGRYPSLFQRYSFENTDPELNYDLADVIGEKLCDGCPKYKECQPEPDEGNDDQLEWCVEHIADILAGKYPTELEFLMGE